MTMNIKIVVLWDVMALVWWTDASAAL